MARKWTDEEIQFLKFAYPNRDFTTKEIAEALNRSYESIRTRAKLLNINRYKENVPDGYKKCTKCENILPFSYFTKRGDNKALYRSWCKHCRNKENREYMKRIKYGENYTDAPNTDVPNPNVPMSKKCRDCNEVKPISEFYKNKNNKDKYENFCKKCSNIRKEKSMLKKLQERGW